MFQATVPVFTSSQDPSTPRPALTFVRGGEKTGRFGRDDNGVEVNLLCRA
jgi:hypothetical protein